MKNTKLKTKSGVASLYLVIFVTLLLGVITLTFTRIMITESRESSNSDLSQSAYDAALAGVEDAKLALLYYHDCVSQNVQENASAALGTCARAIAEMRAGTPSSTNPEGSCDVVSKVLGREGEGGQGTGEVIVQGTYDGSNANDDQAQMNQAYTCVKITENTVDYRTTLSSNDRVRIVPIRTDDYQDVKAVKLSWYSDTNEGAASKRGYSSSVGGARELPALSGASSKYPVVTFELFQTDENFSLYQLDVNNSNNSGTDHAMITLYPATSGGKTTVSASDLLAVSNKDSETAISKDLQPEPVSCVKSGEFYCNTVIEIPSTYGGGRRAESTFFFRLTLPYGTPDTDFSVTLCKTSNCSDSGNPVRFTGVQAQIDSTGRASTLYRRVETRVELVDVNYPYPEFEIQLINEGEKSYIEKNHYVTYHCWMTGSGSAGECPNNAITTSTFYQ